MKNKRTLIHLDDLCKEFQILLLDTSAIVSPLDREFKGNRLIDRINLKKAEGASSVFFNKCLKEKGVFYITQKVFDECYREENPPIREALAKYENMKLSKKEKKYFGSICSLKKERSSLLKSFKKYKKIINLDNPESKRYQEVFRRNFSLKSKNKLSDVDYDLLITGAVLSQTRGETAVLSNDFPLLYSYNALVNKEKIDFVNYGFFIRIKQKHFSRANPFS